MGARPSTHLQTISFLHFFLFTGNSLRQFQLGGAEHSIIVHAKDAHLNICTTKTLQDHVDFTSLAIYNAASFLVRMHPKATSVMLHYTRFVPQSLVFKVDRERERNSYP